MAYERPDTDIIADVLDAAEHLPRLMAGQADRTAEFREFLVELAAKYPELPFALERSDAPMCPDVW